jgi:hypothetical protein
VGYGVTAPSHPDIIIENIVFATKFAKVKVFLKVSDLSDGKLPKNFPFPLRRDRGKNPPP